MLRTAWAAIAAHRTRSALTMIGISIGIFSIYTLVSVALGATNEIKRMGDSLSAKGVYVSPRGQSQTRFITEKDLRALRALLDVEMIIASNSASVDASVKDTTEKAQVTGSDGSYLGAQEAKIVLGRNLTPYDGDKRASVMLISEGAKERFFGQGDLLGETVLLNGLTFTVVGIFGTIDPDQRDQSEDFIIPRSTMVRRLVSQSGVSLGAIESLEVFCWRVDDVENVAAQIRRYFDVTRNIGAMDRKQFSIFTTTAMHDQINQISLIFTLMLGAIGSITLLVGGVGVMNIMLVSVVERTPEIGLRMSVGATQSHILIQFLTEAVLLCLLAGAIGIVIAMGVCSLINSFDVIPMPISLNLAVISLSFCIAVGLIAGVAPAWRASKLSPVDALNAL